MLEAVLFACMAALLVVSGACSATETALFGLTHADRTTLASRYPRASRAALAAMSHPRGALITILVMNTTVNVTFFILSSLLSARSENAGVAAAIGLGSLLAVIVLGEVVPKLLANAHRVAFTVVLAPLVVAASRALGPLRILLDSVIVAPLARVVIPSERPPALRTEELEALLETASSEGLIERDDHRLLTDVVALNQLRVRDAMTPRGNMAWISAEAGNAAFLDAARAHRAPSLLVCDPTPDGSVLGVIKVREALAAIARDGVAKARPIDLRKAASAVPFVPDRARLDRVLALFNEKGVDTAVCVDETGAVTGIIALDDVVRALGLAPIEGGSRDHERVERVGPRQWAVSGRLPVHDWAALFGAGTGAASLDRRASTVGGLVVAALGRLPVAGDEVRIGRITLSVESTSGRTVERVIVTLTEGAETPAPA